MDLTKLTDADLEALNSGDLTKVSDAGLAMLQAEAPKVPAQQPAQAEEPSILGKIAGAGQVAGELAAEHPVATAAAEGAAWYLPINAT